MKNTKRILSLLLSVVMLCTLAAPLVSAKTSVKETKIAGVNGKVSFFTEGEEGYYMPYMSNDMIAFREEKTNLWGYFSAEGKVAVKAKYNSASYFSYADSKYTSLAIVGLKNKIGMINKKGTVVIPIKYDKLMPFDYSENFTLGSRSGNIYLIDRKGKEKKLSSKYGDFGGFRYGLARIQDKKTGKWGFINTKCAEVIKLTYDEVRDISYAYSEKNKTYTYAAIKKDSKWGFINAAGKVICKPTYEAIGWGFGDKLLSVTKNGKYGFVNYSGKLVIPCTYEWSGGFVSGLACVSKNGKYGQINTKNKLVIGYKYDKASSLYNGLIAAMTNNKGGYIDKTGKTVIPFKFDQVESFYDSRYAEVGANGKVGLIDKKGKLVVKTIYDMIQNYVSDKYIAVKNKDKYGIVSVVTGGVVKKLEYDQMAEVVSLKKGENTTIAIKNGVPYLVKVTG